MSKLLSKWLVLLLIGMISVTSYSAEKLDLTKIALHSDDDFSDLAQFANAIAGKRIVYLDELTHGEHEVFALKARLVKYLHQKQGFAALIIESGLFDVQEIVKKASMKAGESIASQAPGNIFFSYAADPAFLDLMHYIDAQRHTAKPLGLAGFDGRLSGEYSVNRFVKQLQQQIQALPEAKTLLADWEPYAKQLQATLERQFAPLTERQVQQHIQKGFQIMDALIAADLEPTMDSASYYARLLEGVIRLFEVHYLVRRFDEHDLVMANNIYWLLENLYNNQKIIVWGHNVHVNRQGYLALRTNNITTALEKAYDKQSYIVNFAGLSGQYRDYVDGQVKTLPTLNTQHLAYRLQSQFEDTPHAIFIEPQQFAAEQYRDLLLQGHEYHEDYQIPVHLWRNHFDSIFLINSVTP